MDSAEEGDEADSAEDAEDEEVEDDEDNEEEEEHDGPSALECSSCQCKNCVMVKVSGNCRLFFFFNHDTRYLLCQLAGVVWDQWQPQDNLGQVVKTAIGRTCDKFGI